MRGNWHAWNSTNDQPVAGCCMAWHAATVH